MSTNFDFAAHANAASAQKEQSSTTWEVVKGCAEQGLYIGVTIATAIVVVTVARKGAEMLFGQNKE